MWYKHAFNKRFLALPGQMEALSSFGNMSHVLDLMLRGTSSCREDAASPGVCGCSYILKWSALLISDVSLFPWSSQGSICSLRSAQV